MEQELYILLHVVIAAVLSGFIGLEREKFEKPAGIRTNMIVGGAVCLLVCLGKIMVVNFQGEGFAELIRVDPTRIIQAIIVGISFIGAGIVLQLPREHKIKNLTTAATILFSSGIGIAVALNQYIIAVGVTIFILIINYVLRLIEARLMNKKR